MLLVASCGPTQPRQPVASRPTTAPATARPTPPPVRIRYRVEIRTHGGEDFAEMLDVTMTDPRGWTRARFDVRESADAPYRVILAEGDEVDRLCKPYDTGGEFSCQNGPIVAINAERWREGVPHWPSDLRSYRTMLLNHEMGHLLGQHHRPCPGPGEIAPVMYQQSGGLGSCKANAWPLKEEIDRAARHDLKLAPEYGE